MKNILIVGAGKGIGLKTAEIMAAENNLFTISRTVTNNLRHLNANNFELEVTNNDLTVLEQLPPVLHGLVYCPGSISLNPFNRLTQDDFLKDMQQNLLSAVAVLQKVLPNLKQANGASIVLFSTVAVKVGMPFHASIAAAKGAVEGLAKSLAAELAQHKIRVNVIAPSLTDTALATSLLNTPEKREAAAKRHPLQKIGEPAEIAKMAAFLLSDDSSWMTGQIIGVDGGMGSLKV